jgi:hypothetical protein
MGYGFTPPHTALCCRCENPDWIAAGQTPRCAGDGDESGLPYFDCACSNVDVDANFASFGRVSRAFSYRRHCAADLNALCLVI